MAQGGAAGVPPCRQASTATLTAWATTFVLRMEGLPVGLQRRDTDSFQEEHNMQEWLAEVDAD